jgi:hypothetical protein
MQAGVACQPSQSVLNGFSQAVDTASAASATKYSKDHEELRMALEKWDRNDSGKV